MLDFTLLGFRVLAQLSAALPTGGIAIAISLSFCDVATIIVQLFRETLYTHSYIYIYHSYYRYSCGSIMELSKLHPKMLRKKGP